VKVTVRFFASVREITGTGEMELEMQPGETVSGVLNKLKSMFPGFQDSHLMLAVNTEYVQPDHKLKEGDEVALIPLVSGG
jgi:molybdopterin converting factor subunit 1